MTTDNQTLQQLLTERVTAFANGDRPREIIDKAVEAMFVDVIKDAFRSYGDLGKAVQEAIKAALPANVSDMFELTRYNALIANALREQWMNSGIEADMLRRANKAMAEALKDEAIPSRVSLRELLTEFVDQHKDDAAQNQWEHPEIRFRDSEYGGMHIFFDPEPESSHRDSGLFSRNKERGDWGSSSASACAGTPAKARTWTSAETGSARCTRPRSTTNRSGATSAFTAAGSG